MKKGIFFIRTPIQYYNAVEAKEHFADQIKQTVLVIISDYPPTLEQFDEIIDTEQWDEIYYPWRTLSKWTAFNWLNRLLNVYRKRKLKKINTLLNPNDLVFWGNYNSVWLRYFCSLNPNEITIIDDGFATLNIPHHLNGNKLEFPSSKKVSFFSETMFLSGHDKMSLNRMRFFTSFKSIHEEVDKRSTVCTYENLKTKVQDNEVNHNLVYFIGQPLIYLSIIDTEKYVNSVNKVMEHYQKIGMKCVYIPHRSSVHNYIPESWDVLNLNFPIEKLLFDRNEELPKTFCSFYSSGIYYLEQFYAGKELTFEYWVMDELLALPAIKNCYSYLEKNRTINTFLKNIED